MMSNEHGTKYARTAKKSLLQPLTSSTGRSYSARALPWSSYVERKAYQESMKVQYVEIRDLLMLFRKKVGARKGMRLKFFLNKLMPEHAKEYESLRRSYLRVFHKAGWSMVWNPDKKRRTKRPIPSPLQRPQKEVNKGQEPDAVAPPGHRPHPAP
jgi:hypothetical protein